MARKVFISFLGETNYRYCDYQKDGKSYGNVRFAQEATLNYLNVNELWSQDDVAIILLTHGAEASNWVDNGQKDKDGKVIVDAHTNDTLEGLESRLKRFNIKTDTIKDLPDGNDEKEIWEIFERIFERIEDNDELYFDITHGFRYLPMLVLVLCNYSKFLKKISVKSITYGNFEVARKIGHGLIVDLLPLTQLQDWTYAAGQYLDSGNVKKMVDLKSIVRNEKLNCIIDALEIVIKERQTCRGKQIHTSENLTVLKSALSDYLSTKTDDSPEEEPLHYVLKKVDASLKDFDIKTNFMNGFNAAKWCAENGLFQQAITLLLENFITLFCERHWFDIKDKDMRDVVGTALSIQVNKKQNNKRKWPDDLTEQNIIDIEKVLQDEWVKPIGKHNNDLIHIFRDIRDYRNNFNHAGFNEGTPNPKEIEEKVNEFVTRTLELFAKVS